MDARHADPSTEQADVPDSAPFGFAGLLLVVVGLGMLLLAAWGLAVACIWAMLSAGTVGGFLGPDSETEQTTGVLLALAGSVAAGTAFATGLALILRGSKRRWPKNATLLAPPAVAFTIAVAAAIFSSAVN